MAMTKGTRLKLDELEHKVRLLSAFRWSAPVKPDVEPPHGRFDYTYGYWYRTHDLHVYPAWSSGIYSGYGHEAGIHSQHGAKALYRSELAALRALRHAVELEAAERLAKIDQRIADEEAKSCD